MRARRTLVAASAALALLGPVASAGAADDPARDRQYGLDQIGAPRAWSASTGSGVTIAIVDTGVDLDHPDLAGKLVAGVDLVDRGTPPDDEEGHGTHVAGIAAAVTGNGRGIAGVAPEARVMPVRVLDRFGSGNTRTIGEGIRWAVDHGARVINLSLGDLVTIVDLGLGDYERDIAYAWGKGAVVVASAGNTELVGAGAPSGYSRDVQAVVVTATDRERRHPSWANRADTAWSLSAPGAEILSTARGGGYAFMSGTSMAAPHVSGVAALALARGLSPAQTVERLLATAARLGDRSVDGAGLVDAAAAVPAAAARPAATVPPATAPAPATSRPAATTPPAPATGPAPTATATAPAAGPLELASPQAASPALRAPLTVPQIEPLALPVSNERDMRRARQTGLGLAALLLAASVAGFVRSTRRLR